MNSIILSPLLLMSSSSKCPQPPYSVRLRSPHISAPREPTRLPASKIHAGSDQIGKPEDIWDAWTFFKLLDTDGGGMVEARTSTFHFFVEGEKEAGDVIEENRS